MKMLKIMPYEVLGQNDWSINALLSSFEIENKGLPLSELVDFDPEKVSKRKDIIPDQTYSYVDLSAVSSEKGIITDYKSVLGEDLPSRATLKVKTGDIILSTVRPERNLVAVVDEHLSGSIINSTFTVLRPKERTNLSPFLYFTLRSEQFQQTLNLIARGTAVPTIRVKDLKALKLLFKDIKESLVKKANSLYDYWLHKQSNKISLEKIVEIVFGEHLQSVDMNHATSESLIKVVPYNKLQNRLDVGFYMTPSDKKSMGLSYFKVE
ncbi:Type I restriction modification DNA specificity domain-containing protein [Thalassobacillus cyri]|uniref:Type I restriction modification DNA specificity domain-containing protein n=1 Tax=Thalassobacillus cyri TaxID=571932 RepID=A0A1H3VZL3_9BACI|nr:restriction endonuclease subunit S [Thalassobacillus cyri]SDZ79512.1 Type I restriction modification DNA specificity domain-containing protein [Thalassobacillus cyri]